MHSYYYWQPCTPHRGCDNKWSRRAPDLLQPRRSARSRARRLVWVIAEPCRSRLVDHSLSSAAKGLGGDEAFGALGLDRRKLGHGEVRLEDRMHRGGTSEERSEGERRTVQELHPRSGHGGCTRQGEARGSVYDERGGRARSLGNAAGPATA